MSWQVQKINNGGVTSGPPFLPSGKPLFVSVYKNQQHFSYFDVSANIQDAWFDGNAWNLQQINNAGALQGPPAEYIAYPGATAPMVGNAEIFVSVYNDQHHFAYIDSNQNIQDVWYDGDAWNLQQINNATPEPSVPNEYVACPSAHTPAAMNLFVTVYDNQQHFTYLDNTENIHDVWYDGDQNEWNVQQITNSSVGEGHGVPPPPSGEYLVCPEATDPVFDGFFVSVYDNQQHFVSVDATRIQDVWYDGGENTWNLQQINNPDNAGPYVPGEYVASPAATSGASRGLFISVYQGQQHVAYADWSGNIQDVWYDGNEWNLQQIGTYQGTFPESPEYIAYAGATAQVSFLGIFVSVYGDQQHFAYIDDQSNIQDVWYDGNKWNLQQINNSTPAPSVSNEYVACRTATAAAAGNLFVSVYGNQQHFTYCGPDSSGDIWDCFWTP